MLVPPDSGNSSSTTSDLPRLKGAIVAAVFGVLAIPHTIECAGAGETGHQREKKSLQRFLIGRDRKIRPLKTRDDVWRCHPRARYGPPRTNGLRCPTVRIPLSCTTSSLVVRYRRRRVGGARKLVSRAYRVRRAGPKAFICLNSRWAMSGNLTKLIGVEHLKSRSSVPSRPWRISIHDFDLLCPMGSAR